MTEQVIRIGIIGSGGIARMHARAYKRIPGVVVAAVADIVPGRAQALIDEEGLVEAAEFDNTCKLLEQELHGVSICTPNVSHHKQALLSLEAGKHVLVEKPLSVTLDEGIEMVETAERMGKMLSVGFQPRYDDNIKLVREIVQSGKLGGVYYAELGGGRPRGIPGGTFIRRDVAGSGAIADIGCYSLDMALYALNHPRPLTVSAFSSNRLGTNPAICPEADRFDVEDFGVAFIRFENDMVMTFKTSWAMHLDSMGSTFFLGSEGGLKLGSGRTGAWGGSFDCLGDIRMYRDMMGRQTETVIPLSGQPLDEPFFLKISDFVRAIRDDAPAPVPASEILVQQTIIDALLRSAAQKREVDVEWPSILRK